jgi:SpoVK/Ycf46/Vps4 family AAA+-type ATPase
MVQAIASQTEGTVVIVPRNYISNLDDPNLATLCIEEKQKGKSITFLLEDGDTCITKRDGSNNSIVSTILNMSDGIMGKLLDIRFIITTNLPLEDIDEAIMRPGRLLDIINIEKLEPLHAKVIFDREKKDSFSELPEQENYSLAEIYQFALNNKTKKLKQSTKVGFI